MDNKPTYSTSEIAALLTDRLLSIIKSDYSAFLDSENTLKFITDLTEEQKQLIDSVDKYGFNTMKKSDAIKMLASIAGLNSSTTKLEGGDTPLSMSFSVSYVTPDDESK